MIRNMGCVAKVFNDTLNVGFMDYHAAEKVFENYDVRLDWGKITPALIIFAKGFAYPAPTDTLSADKLANFASNYTENC